MVYKLSNEFIEISVKSKGAELCSLKKVGGSYDYMYQKEEGFWQRQSPSLFPVIGKHLDDEYIYEGDTYHLGKHGFVRDVEFDVESTSDTLIFSFESDEFKVSYPFDFRL